MHKLKKFMFWCLVILSIFNISNSGAQEQAPVPSQRQAAPYRVVYVMSRQEQATLLYRLVAFAPTAHEAQHGVRHYLVPNDNFFARRMSPTTLARSISLSDEQVLYILSGFDVHYQLADFLGQAVSAPYFRDPRFWPAAPAVSAQQVPLEDVSLYMDRTQRPRVVSVHQLIQLPREGALRGGGSIGFTNGVSVQSVAYYCFAPSVQWGGRWCYGVQTLVDQAAAAPETVVQGVMSLGQSR